MAQGGFIERHGLWSDEQRRRAAELVGQADKDKLRLVRLAWIDPHGCVRAKAVTRPAFTDALKNGYNVNIATSTLDASGGRIFRSFVKGGGMDLDEMTGSPNLIVVPDPDTFRVLPWAPDIGWVLCDDYFTNGKPFYFSSRHLLKRQIERLAQKGLDHIVGLEIELYVAKIVQDNLTPENVGWPGRRPKPPETASLEPGYSYHSETNLDILQPILSKLAAAIEGLGLPLRSVENEWGPGQIEVTFSATQALQAADNCALFRTATRQVCRREGLLATFMARPGLPGHYASGWHLHQSLADAATGENKLMPTAAGALLSPMGQSFLAGLLEHAVPATLFATPTITGYRRFKSNSLAPDRATWGFDHRGTLMRVIGGTGDPATRIENRAGEPSANPYFFFASQIVAGLDGLDRDLPLGPADLDPYNAPRPLLPTSLDAALEAFAASPLFKAQFGELFVDYYLKFKQAELDRFQAFCRENGVQDPADDVTQWEQNEYFDFF